MKSVIITGTSKGIGLETALAFARAGYKVFATLRNSGSATGLKEKIKAESLPITIFSMDVNSDEAVEECIGDILEEHGPVDVLVNNAGIEYHGSVEEMEIDKFKAVMETNYLGVIRCIKGVLPAMRKNGSGCIINVSSISGKIAGPPFGAYSPSKFAIEALSEILAAEVKPFNIRVAIVEPGITDTPMAHALQIAGNSNYPHARRSADLFTAVLKTPTPPSLVASKILEVADSDSWQLRHPVGPEAIPFLHWRAGISDEQWVDWNAASDDEYYTAVENTFGLQLRHVKQD